MIEGAPFVSVVIPTRDRAALLRECLRSVRAQSYPPDRYEIVVVDDGSRDDTPNVVAEAVASGPPVTRYVRMDRKGLNAARNAGIAAAKGDPICFVDDDVDAPSTWLPAVVDGVLRHPEAGCFGGPIRLRLEARPPRMCGRDPLGETELDLGSREVSVSEVYGANLVLRRKALERAGLFDESLPIYGDEIEWQRRYRREHGTIWYIPEAWLWHRRTADQLRFTILMRARFRRGVNDATYQRRVGTPPGLGRLMLSVGRHVGHSVRRLCAIGLLDAAGGLGQLWGTLRRTG